MNTDFVNLTKENSVMSIYAALFAVKSLMRVLTRSGNGFPTD